MAVHGNAGQEQAMRLALDNLHAVFAHGDRRDALLAPVGDRNRVGQEPDFHVQMRQLGR